MRSYDLPVPFGLGIWEIVILVAILALLFGAKGVPQMARRLGTGVREVRDAVGEVDPRKMLDAPKEPAGNGQARQQAAVPEPAPSGASRPPHEQPGAPPQAAEQTRSPAEPTA